MQVNISHWMFLLPCGVGGVGIGQLTWTMKGGGETPAATSSPTPPAAPLISQTSTGHQSPNVVGSATIIYNAAAPSDPRAAEMKYRAQLADEISASRHSLDKSRNRWYTFSVGNNRPEAEKNWKEAETRMRESAALLRTKVSRTAETAFLQIQAGEPLAHPNLGRPYLPDGAAISEMWHRVTRLQEIEKRLRNGTEPIVYPPPTP